MSKEQALNKITETVESLLRPELYESREEWETMKGFVKIMVNEIMIEEKARQQGVDSE